MPSATVMIVEDEDAIRWSIKEHLGRAQYRVLEADSGQEALRQLDKGVDLVLLDYKLPDADGLSLMKEIKKADPDTLVILMTAYSSVEMAVRAMKEGAYHYANKPLNMEETMMLVEKALETTALRREVRSLRANQHAPYSLASIIGESPLMKAVKELLAKIARSPASTVLLTGESGTGKDVAAKVIHYSSDRAHRPLMNITCSALHESLLESELFGHERGAFTDAKERKKGLLEQADGGTVFLDEIGEMAPAMQAKLLRFLEDRCFKRVGGTEDIRVDVRIIAATNRNLEDSVKQGAFREDLYYRLSVLPIRLPALRERPGDTPLLLNHFIDMFNREFRKDVRAVSPQAMEQLESYGFPGNVRELKNIVERAVLLADGSILTPKDFVILSRNGRGGALELPPEGVNFEQLELSLITQALKRCKGNQTQAAALLGMNRDQIRYRVKKFGLWDLKRPGSNAPPSPGGPGPGLPVPLAAGGAGEGWTAGTPVDWEQATSGSDRDVEAPFSIAPEAPERH
jgi:two-component system, NtrC family, response regulator AtoC